MRRHASWSEHECGARSGASHTSTSGVGGRLTGGKWRGAGTAGARAPPASHLSSPFPLPTSLRAPTTPGSRLITPRGAPLPFSSCSCELFAAATLPPAPVDCVGFNRSMCCTDCFHFLGRRRNSFVCFMLYRHERMDYWSRRLQPIKNQMFKWKF